MEPKEIISSGVLELYVMGLSSAEETRNVESWAKQYPEVAAEIDAIASGIESYAQAHAIEPAASVKEKLMSRIKEEDKPVMKQQRPEASTAKIYSISPFWKYAAAASIVLLIGSLIFNYSYYNKYQNTSTKLVVTQTELQEQKELADAMHGDMDKMTDKNAMPVSLKGVEVPTDAARIYWMQDTHEVYLDPSNLPKAPEGMQYQFWGIVDGKPVSGGMITLSDGSTVHLQKMKSFGKVEAFAVSLEKAGPEKEAPSKVIVMGKI